MNDDEQERRGPGRSTDSRHRLLEAGMALLAESSRSDLSRVLTTGAVAERAGLHRQTFYLYWASQAEYLDDFVDHVTDPSVSSQSERLSSLAERMPDPTDDAAAEVRARAAETFTHWTDDPVHVSRMVLWALHGADEAVAERLRALYRTNDQHTAEGYRRIGDQWGVEPRPPFTYESIALLFNALRDGLLLHLTVDATSVPPSFVEDVNLALTWAVTRRVDDPDDDVTLDERFRREVDAVRRARAEQQAQDGAGPSAEDGPEPPPA